MRRVIVVNRFFHPDYSATSRLLSDLTFHLAARGWKVEVVTSRQRYDDPSVKLPSRETVRGVSVRRVAATRFGRAFLPGRAIDYLSFYISAFLTLLVHADRHAIVVAETDPPLISVFAAVAAKLRGARLINWIQDLFPEVAEALGVTRRATILRSLRDWSLGRARANVVLSEDMGARVARNVVVQHNWADGELRPIAPSENTLLKEWQLTDRFVVVYGGNLGRAHEFDTIATAAKQVPEATFVFIGGGAGQAALQRDIGGLDNVQFRPYQPNKQALSESLSTAGVQLVSLQPQLEGLIVPSKFYGILAFAQPVIYIGSRDAELPKLIVQHDCGFVVAMGDGEGLARAIRTLANDRQLAAEMGRRGRALHEARFAPELALAHWEQILMEAGS